MPSTATVVVGRARLPRPAVRHRLVRRPPRRGRPQPHPLAVRLHLFAGRLLHVLDILRRGRHGRTPRHRVHHHLHRTDDRVPRLVVPAAQDRAHRQGAAHHLDRRLHRLALRQEPQPRHDRHRHRGGRHDALHRPAAEGGVEHLRRARRATTCLPTSPPSCRLPPAILADAAFLTAIGMAIFAILFGTRHIDANEHHEGMVAAIAFESCVKLLAFLAVGVCSSSSRSDPASASTPAPPPCPRAARPRPASRTTTRPLHDHDAACR